MLNGQQHIHCLPGGCSRGTAPLPARGDGSRHQAEATAAGTGPGRRQPAPGWGASAGPLAHAQIPGDDGVTDCGISAGLTAPEASPTGSDDGVDP